MNSAAAESVYAHEPAMWSVFFELLDLLAGLLFHHRSKDADTPTVLGDINPHRPTRSAG